MDPFSKMRFAVRQAIPGLQTLLDKQVPDASEGERLLALGNYEEAELFFERLIEQLDARPHRKTKPGGVMVALAKARWHQKKYAEAEDAARKAIPLIEGASASSELAESYDLLGRIRLARHDKAGAIERFEQALAAQRKIRPLDQGAIIERSRKLAEVYAQEGRWREARDILKEAAEIAERECGNSHQLTADCLSEYGRSQAECGQHEDARRTLEKALEVHVAACGPDSEEVAKDFQALAVACQAAEDLEAAIGYYERALRLRERQLGGSTSDYASLLMDIAGANSLLGRYGPAVELMQQAVGRFEGTRDERLGPALESLGTVYLLCGRVEDAIAALKKARRIYEKQPDDYQDRLEANTRLFETASTYLNAVDAGKLLASVRPLTEEEAAAAQAAARPSAQVRSAAKPRRSPAPAATAPASEPAGPMPAVAEPPPWPLSQPSSGPPPSSAVPEAAPVPVLAALPAQVGAHGNTAGTPLPAVPAGSLLMAVSALEAQAILASGGQMAELSPAGGAVPTAASSPVVVPLSPAEAQAFLAAPVHPAPAEAHASSPGSVRIAVLSHGGTLPAAAPGGYPLGGTPYSPGGITILVPGSSLPPRADVPDAATANGPVPAAAGVSASAPVSASQSAPAELNGWDELACDFLTIS